MKNKTQPFVTRMKGHVLEVWLGDPDHSESEFVLSIHYTYVPALIAILRSTQQ